MPVKLKLKPNPLVRNGITFSGYNQPKMTPNHPTKKAVVLAKEGDQVKIVRYGAKGYSSNYSDEARKQYRQRHADEVGSSKLTAGYWALKHLWSASSPKIRAGKTSGKGERFN